jgi:hypothetical protein
MVLCAPLSTNALTLCPFTSTLMSDDGQQGSAFTPLVNKGSRLAYRACARCQSFLAVATQQQVPSGVTPSQKGQGIMTHRILHCVLHVLQHRLLADHLFDLSLGVDVVGIRVENLGRNADQQLSRSPEERGTHLNLPLLFHLGLAPAPHPLLHGSSELFWRRRNSLRHARVDLSSEGESGQSMALGRETPRATCPSQLGHHFGVPKQSQPHSLHVVCDSARAGCLRAGRRGNRGAIRAVELWSRQLMRPDQSLPLDANLCICTISSLLVRP